MVACCDFTEFLEFFTWIDTQKNWYFENRFIFQVEGHDTKLEELENLVKSQASLIEELKTKQVELTSALDSKQVQLEAAIAEQKVQAAKELSDVKVALEQSQEQAKVSLAQQLDQLTVRAETGEERQVGLAKHLKQLQIYQDESRFFLSQNKSRLDMMTGREQEFEQFIKISPYFKRNTS